MRLNIPMLNYSLAALVAVSLSTITVSADDGPATADKVSVFDAGDLKIPAEFKRIEPKMQMIDHEFEIPGAAGVPSTRITMMAAGGDVTANIDRWKGQFAGGKKELNKTEVMKVGNWEVHIVDLNGSFGESMGGGPFSGGKTVQRPDYGMTAAILIHPEGKKFFVKMIGPESTVKANRDKFVKMIKDIK